MAGKIETNGRGRSIEEIGERLEKREAERAREISAQKKRARHVKRETEIETKALAAIAIGHRPQLGDSEHLDVRTIESPYTKGKRVNAVVSLRNDPLGRLYKRHQIDDAQMQAGRKWQEDWEEAEIGGARAIDPARVAVDGGRIPETWNERRMAAATRLSRCAKWLGLEGEALVRDVLGNRMSLALCATSRGMSGGKHDLEYLGRRLRECLETLAYRLGFAVKASGPQSVHDDDTALADVAANPRLYDAVQRSLRDY